MMDRPPMLQRLAEVSAGIGWRVLLFAIAIGLLAGVVEAVVWGATPAESGFQGNEGECPGGRQPPCFDLPDISSLPLALVPMVPYVLALVVFLALGVPGLVAGVWDVAQRRWRAAARALLTFAGPMLVFIGTETVPHAVLAVPCGILEPDLCSRLHQLEHVLFGLVPMTLLYRSALLRWSPGVVR
ncbi:MAG TPA: hypothetical protein VIM50_01600 [Candidatus Limnocylindria bacterium]